MAKKKADTEQTEEALTPISPPPWGPPSGCVCIQLESLEQASLILGSLPTEARLADSGAYVRSDDGRHSLVLPSEWEEEARQILEDPGAHEDSSCPVDEIETAYLRAALAEEGKLQEFDDEMRKLGAGALVLWQSLPTYRRSGRDLISACGSVGLTVGSVFRRAYALKTGLYQA